MNAHITKPIDVETMLRTMAEWMTPLARSLPGDPAQTPTMPSSFGAPIETRRGLAHCVGNEALYRRLLRGFRDTEASFVEAMRAAWAEGRTADALRRWHDMKGLAGAIGAKRLRHAAEALEAALRALMPAAAAAPAVELDRTAAELDLVMRQIDLLLAAP